MVQMDCHFPLGRGLIRLRTVNGLISNRYALLCYVQQVQAKYMFFLLDNSTQSLRPAVRARNALEEPRLVLLPRGIYIV